MKKVLFIGAGASFGARPNSNLPLGNTLAQYLIEKLNSALKTQSNLGLGIQFAKGFYTKMISDALTQDEAYELKTQLEKSVEDKISFESWVLTHKDNHKIIKPLNRTLGWIFSGIDAPEFQEEADFFDILLKKLAIDRDWIIVSLNDDTLIEDSMKRCEIPFCYPGIEYGNFGKQCVDAVKVFKPHGSFNWRVTFPQASASEAVARKSASRLELENGTFTAEDKALVSDDRKEFLF